MYGTKQGDNMDKIAKRGFASHPDLAKKWGKINGKKYKRGKSKPKVEDS